MNTESKRDFIIDMFDNMEEEQILSILSEYHLINVRETASKIIYSMNENSTAINTLYDYLVNEY